MATYYALVIEGGSETDQCSWLSITSTAKNYLTDRFAHAESGGLAINPSKQEVAFSFIKVGNFES